MEKLEVRQVADDNKKQYSEWSGCQCRALPSRTSQVAAHQRGSGESIPARRRDQGLVGEAQEGTRHEFERFRQFVIGPIASSGPATIWRHLGNRPAGERTHRRIEGR